MTATAERAYDWVKRRVLDGTYPGGMLLSEGQVADALDISRTPVREAFLRLQTEGFLKLYPKRGALVTPVTIAEARSLGEARLMIEDFALRLVAERGADALARLGADLLNRTPPGDLKQWPTAAIEFHRTLVRASGNPLIEDMFNHLCDRHLRLLSAAAGEYGPDRDEHEHEELARLIHGGKVTEATTALSKHLANIFGGTNLR